jgi:hypothetical protein
MAAANPLVKELLDRVARLERAAGECGFQLHGPRGLASLYRQAPAWAALVQEYMDGTTAASDGNFVGRVEKAVPTDTKERR